MILRGKERTSIIPARVGTIFITVTTSKRVTPISSVASNPKREHVVTGAKIFGLVGLGLFSFLANLIDTCEKLDQLFC
jgi:hypothetical protein